MTAESDFVRAARRLVAEAEALGGVFRADGSWVMNDGRPPLPHSVADRLRTLRAAVRVVLGER